jgi:hypothetical protein
MRPKEERVFKPKHRPPCPTPLLIIVATTMLLHRQQKHPPQLYHHRRRLLSRRTVTDSNLSSNLYNV